MAETKKVRVEVRTRDCSYVGTVHMPAMRNRVSDMVNEDRRMFLNLTDVVIDKTERREFVSVNKNLIVSILELEGAKVFEPARV